MVAGPTELMNLCIMLRVRVSQLKPQSSWNLQFVCFNISSCHDNIAVAIGIPLNIAPLWQIIPILIIMCRSRTQVRYSPFQIMRDHKESLWLHNIQKHTRNPHPLPPEYPKTNSPCLPNLSALSLITGGICSLLQCNHYKHGGGKAMEAELASTLPDFASVDSGNEFHVVCFWFLLQVFQKDLLKDAPWLASPVTLSCTYSRIKRCEVGLLSHNQLWSKSTWEVVS